MASPNLPIRPYGPAVIQDAAALIRAGGIVAVPTETVYGLAADATDPDAVAAIYAAKGRPAFNPLIVHVPDLAEAQRFATFDDDAHRLAEAFWPGPLTLVLPLRHGTGIAAAVTAGAPTIAIRIPAARAMRDLIAATGVPLAAPSANASNAISPTTAAHVAASLGERVPLIIDDGACPAGLESTIVAGREILRPGPITADMVRACLGDDARPPRMSPQPAVAPGQQASHYAPRKPLRLNADRAQSGEWLIGFGETPGDDTLGTTLIEAAANLFAALHRADAAPMRAIAVVPIPEDGIGTAINDRLRRAAYRRA